MTDLDALRLLTEWGADEALADAPVDRFAAPAAAVRGPAAPAQPSGRPAPARPVAAAASSQASGLASAARTLDELHAAAAGFDGCPLRAMATSTVRPDGNPAAGLVLIAEAPGADDDRSGTAFAGATGALLDRVLAGIGLDRSAMLLTHLVPWRPPGSRAPTEAEVAACLPFLHRLLALTEPRRLVLLGTGPVKALTGATDSIRRLRGRWLEVSTPGLNVPMQALPLIPLEQWMRSPATKRDLWSDLLELRQSTDQVR